MFNFTYYLLLFSEIFMSKLIFDDTTYFLKRNPFTNVLFILFMLYSLFFYYRNYPNILKEITTLKNLDPIALILTLIAIIFFYSIFILIFVTIYFLSVYFEFDVKSNKLMTYRYFILWKYHMKLIELQDYKDIGYQDTSQSKKLFLDPKNDSAKKVYLTSVTDKKLKTEVWQLFLRDLKKTF